VGERSEERSQPIPELADGAQESKSPDKVMIEDVASDITSSCSNSSNVPRDAILPLVAPALSKLGPGSPSESRAQLSCLPDVPHKADIFC
jgi:hypothetical protein